MAKNVYAKDIKEGDRVETSFLVIKKETGMSKTGKAYLNLKLRDSTGDLEARVWDNAESVGECFSKDDVVAIKGSAILYQGKIQVNVSEARTLSVEDCSIRDYLPSSKRTPEDMMTELDSIISGMGDRHLKRLMKDIFSDAVLRERFMTAPAAKTMHHPYLGGLIEHVLSLCSIGRFVASHYEGINKDLLISGAILHDIGKIYELSYSRTFDYTDEGRLLGHITIGVELVDSKINAIADFPRRLGVLLKHMLLSHHGHLEFGSPKRPKTLEAMALYFLDDFDAKMNSMQSLIKSEAGTGDWTDYQRALERYIYKGSYASDESPFVPGGEEKKPESGQPEADEKDNLRLFK
ncbi:MAG: HD domain-containing protein [Deltaproteobacteria bacterium]